MRFYISIKCALKGIKYCLANEENFRFEFLCSIISVIFSFALKISPEDWLAIIFFNTITLTLEMINTAIEKLSDVFTESIHPMIRLIKDVAAGAVLVASLASLAAACIIFIPKIYLIITPFFQ
jgi:undecaprenol kinase